MGCWAADCTGYWSMVGVDEGADIEEKKVTEVLKLLQLMDHH